MKIIHCADIHIDCKNFNKFSEEKRKIKRLQTIQNFIDMVDFAEKNQVFAILLCGDIFDTPKPIKKSLKLIQDIILAHPSITFFYIWGNHDEKVVLFEKNPPNFVAFGNKFSKFDLGDVCVGGIGYQRNMPYSVYEKIEFNKEDYNILMLHGPTPQGDVYSAAIEMKFLAGRYIDYLALGHIHAKTEGKIDKRGIWSYSGALESNKFSGVGDGFGFYVLDIKEKKMERTFVPFAKYKYRVEEVSVTGVKNFENLLKLVQDKLSLYGESDIVKVIFSGFRKEEDEINLELIYQKFSENFFYFELEDNTRMKFDLDKYASEQLSLKAEFIKEIMADKNLSEEEKSQICMIGLEALKGEDISL